MQPGQLIDILAGCLLAASLLIVILSVALMRAERKLRLLQRKKAEETERLMRERQRKLDSGATVAKIRIGQAPGRRQTDQRDYTQGEDIPWFLREQGE